MLTVKLLIELVGFSEEGSDRLSYRGSYPVVLLVLSLLLVLLDDVLPKHSQYPLLELVN